MKVLLFAVCWVFLSVQAAVAQPLQTLSLKNVRADVEIIPENRSDVSVDVQVNGSTDAQPVVTRIGNVVTITGDVETGRQAFRVSFNLARNMDVAATKRRLHIPYMRRSGLILIVVHAPLRVKVKSNAEVFGHIGPSQSVDINDIGEGEWHVDPVEQDIRVSGGGKTDFYLSTSRSVSLDLLGTGSVKLGDTQSLFSSQYGSGDVIASRVYKEVNLNISGIGDFFGQYVSGSTRILIADAGNARIDDASISKLIVRSLDGVGTVKIGGTVNDVDVNIGTSTKVTLHKVTGTVQRATRQLASFNVENP